MHAVRFHDHGGPDVLAVDEIDRPEPGHGEVRVDVAASGVNPVDTYVREGSFPPASLPATPGSDLAGVVDAVGPGVEALAVGDRVFGTGLGIDRPGTCAESVVAPASLLALLPDGITFREGAAVAMVGVTAWRALVDRAALEPAEHCLVHGGSGGVGHVAVQLAAVAGASVTATARPSYEAALRDMGADRVIDYRTDRDALAAAIREGGAPDVILDPRLDEYLGLDAELAATGGRVVGIGNESPSVTLSDLPAARAAELAIHLPSVFNTPDVAAVLERLAHLLRRGNLAPEVARTYDLEAVADAHRTMDEESYLGKLVVEVDRDG